MIARIDNKTALLLGGAMFASIGIFQLATGRILSSRGRPRKRADDPVAFWFKTVIYLSISLFLFFVALSHQYDFSN
jgi:hypothetical protein